MKKQTDQIDPVIAYTVDVWIQPLRESDTEKIHGDDIQSAEDYLTNYLKGEKLGEKEKVCLMMTGSVPNLVLLDAIKNTYLSHRMWPQNMKTVTSFKEETIILYSGTGEEKILHPLKEASAA